MIAAVALLPMCAHAVFAINDPWVKAAPGARVAEAYMELRSSEDIVLVGVRSAAVAGIAIRAPGSKGPVLAELPLPAGETLLLAPNRYRLVLNGLARPLQRGDRVPLVLTLRGADGTEREIPITAEVRKRSSRDDHKGAIAH